MTTHSFAAEAPVHVSKVGIRARDADSLADYYKALLGLVELRRAPDRIVLGVATDNAELLEIERAPTAKPDDPASAGLFHNAFLLPARVDLARWVRHARQNRIVIEGASDHLVSEALYLTDPEGNGIEIYADRPRESWDFDRGTVAMATKRLDFDSLSREPGAEEADWNGAPGGSIIGHVHLRVGDSEQAEEWWKTELGFDTMAKYGGQAVFLSTGGYHHHVGANVWRSQGAGKRDGDRSGLSWVELKSKADRASTLCDPWGTEIRVV